MNIIPKSPTLIRFDWAIKRLLRNKADFVVLEGFLSVLLHEEVKIVSITDSESNREHSGDKFNRVDIIVENSQGKLLIIEMQNSFQADYFQRMLYGVSKAITERMSLGDPYDKVRKVYHINILYFRLGEGLDYVYHGFTEFRGIHNNDLLQLTQQQKEIFAGEKVQDLYPEYFLLCVDEFDNVAKDSLDEWIYYLKNNAIPEGFTAPGLKEARERLLYDELSDEEKKAYNHHVNQITFEQSVIEDSMYKGHAKGLAEGEAERSLLKAELEAAQAEKEAAQAEKEAAQKLAQEQAAQIAELQRQLGKKKLL